MNQWATPPKGPYRIVVAPEFAGAEARLATIPEEERLNWVRYVVKAGDTVSSVANRFDTHVSALAAHNDLDSNIIKIGATLLIPTAANTDGATPLARRAGTDKRRYSVQKGDSLWRISEQFGVSTGALMRLNQIGPKQALPIGRELIIPASKNRTVIKQIDYRVRAGESLSVIADRFNLAIHEILNWNPIDASSYLQPGQKLRLFVDITATN